MMLKQFSSPCFLIKYVFVLPISVIIIFAFARPETSYDIKSVSKAEINDLYSFFEDKSENKSHNDTLVNKLFSKFEDEIMYRASDSVRFDIFNKTVTTYNGILYDIPTVIGKGKDFIYLENDEGKNDTIIKTDQLEHFELFINEEKYELNYLEKNKVYFDKVIILIRMAEEERGGKIMVIN